MALVEFKDLPNTSIPINAENLNNNFNEVNKVNVKNDASLLMSSVDVITITPTTGSNFANYGSCYYYKKGTRVHVHLGLSGLIANTSNSIFTLPEGYRPKSAMSGSGAGGDLSEIVACQIWNTGAITVLSKTTGYALIDIEFDAFD